MMIHRINHAFETFISGFYLGLSGVWPVAVKLALLLVLLFSEAGLAQELQRQITVMAPSAAVMDSPSVDRQEIARLPKGSRLIATGKRSGIWVQVLAPSTVSGWVYGELIRENQIAASSVKVRSGPGIGYGELATLRKGDSVVAQGRRGDWVEVASQPGFTAWVEQSLLSEGAAIDLTVATQPDVPPPSSVSPEELPAPSPEEPPAPLVTANSPPPPIVEPMPPVPVKQDSAEQMPVSLSEQVKRVPESLAPVPNTVLPVVTVRSEPPRELPRELHRQNPSVNLPPPVAVASGSSRPSPSVPVPLRKPRKSSSLRDPLESLRLLPSALQGNPISITGILRPTGFALFAPSPYRLVTQKGTVRPQHTLCYVLSADGSLEGRVGQTVTLEGLRYWIYGCREPVVVVRNGP